MSAFDQATGAAAARNPQPRGGLARSVRDALVVARRNLIRMLRIPNRVRPARLGSISGIRQLNAAGKEQAQ
ncbi:integral membrane transport protein [Streptomyces noursei]|uniref:integral membrane transport protein n=1 Tax=Streptomyces noursei TaxID=1971 RepID=UPI0023B80C5E|nr:integral membrane transport protein [Streptomyces noursei]